MKLRNIFLLSLSILLLSSCDVTKNTHTENTEKVIDSLIAQLTVEEKLAMIHANSSFTTGGVERLGIPELVMSDGPHGVRYEHGHDWERDTLVDDSITYLPTGICLAATWNPDLGYQVGATLGAEANYRGKDVILGPGLNIIRSPLNGRNFEYLSEDPYLTARMTVGYIKGVQDQGVAACAKHFVANNQETNRFTVNVELSEQALREIYLPGFKAAVQEANVLTVMGAYNKLRGEWCMENNYLANDILKGEWNFKGIYLSDWGAVHDTKRALLAGTDIEMGTDLDMLPNPDYSKFYFADTALALINAGEISDTILNDKIRRILRVMYETNTIGERKAGRRNTMEHQSIALQVAEEGIVLLKNEQLLPLKSSEIKTIAVIGENATRIQHTGGGSSQVSALYEITPLEGIQSLVGSEVAITYYPGYEVTRESTANSKLRAEAVKAAAESDVVIYVGGWIHNYDVTEWGKDAYDSEGIDKQSLQMPFGQNLLLQEILNANKNTAVVLMGGGPLDMSDWQKTAKAIVQAWYPGMEGGTALANILFGKTNPSGKLPMTFANELEKYPSHSLGEYPGKNLQVHYSEGIMVGYRYFDTYNVFPAYPFGHGLSYTSFEFSNLHITQDDGLIKLNVTIANTGDMDGAEVVQVYVHNTNSSLNRPLQELKAFSKINLKAGESKTVTLKLKAEDLNYFDETKNSWVLDHSDYEFKVGSSSRDIKLVELIDL